MSAYHMPGIIFTKHLICIISRILWPTLQSIITVPFYKEGSRGSCPRPQSLQAAKQSDSKAELVTTKAHTACLEQLENKGPLDKFTNELSGNWHRTKHIVSSHQAPNTMEEVGDWEGLSFLSHWLRQSHKYVWYRLKRVQNTSFTHLLSTTI